MMFESVSADLSSPAISQQRQEAPFTEFLSVLVPRFGHAVGIDHQQVMRFEPCDSGLVVFLQLNAQGNVIGFQPLDAPILTLENRRIVTGAEITEISGSQGSVRQERPS